jgi:hypothetical protein
MALDAKHRSSIYQKLVPLLGDEDANALMSEFPASEADELVTKQFLRAELAELRSELRGEMAELRSELFGEVRGLDARLAALETKLTLRIGAAAAAQTTVLGALVLLG